MGTTTCSNFSIAQVAQLSHKQISVALRIVASVLSTNAIKFFTLYTFPESSAAVVSRHPIEMVAISSADFFSCYLLYSRILKHFRLETLRLSFKLFTVEKPIWVDNPAKVSMLAKLGKAEDYIK